MAAVAKAEPAMTRLARPKPALTLAEEGLESVHPAG